MHTNEEFEVRRSHGGTYSLNRGDTEVWRYPCLPAQVRDHDDCTIKHLDTHGNDYVNDLRGTEAQVM